MFISQLSINETFLQLKPIQVYIVYIIIFQTLHIQFLKDMLEAVGLEVIGIKYNM